MTNVNEIFLPIPDYEGYYEISNTGKVRSNLRIDCKGRLRKSQKRKTAIDKFGYEKLCLSMAKKNKNFFIHRLVAMAFLPNPNNYLEINHIDGNKLNNNSINIEWCSSSQNAKHSRKIGLHPEIAETHKFASLRNNEAIAIFKSELSYKILSEIFNTSQMNISRIKTGKTWSSVTGMKYVKTKMK